MRKLVVKLGGPQTVAKRGPRVAYTGWGLIIGCGTLGWWGGGFCAFVCLIALSAHLLGRTALTMADG